MYLNIIQLAESFGVEESVVEGWVRKEGLPAIEDRNRLLFDRNQVVDWASACGLAAKAGFLAAGSAGQAARRPRTPVAHRPASGAIAGGQRPRNHGDIGGPASGATPPVRQLLAQRLRLPDGVSWAAVGGGLALPHLRTPVALGRDAGIFAILLLRDALKLNEPSPDDVPITRLLFFVAPSPRVAPIPAPKVISIACDRYIFGLPAVEQYIDARLEAVPADESMLSAIDRSVAQPWSVSNARIPASVTRGALKPQGAIRIAATKADAVLYPRDAFPREANPHATRILAKHATILTSGRVSPRLREALST